MSQLWTLLLPLLHPLESRRNSLITRRVSVHSCIVPRLGEGEVGDSTGKGDGTVNRLKCVSCSLSPRVGPRWRVGLSNSQKEAELTRTDQLVQIPPSSTLLPQFFLFFASSFRLSSVRWASHSVLLPQKGSGGGTASFVPPHNLALPSPRNNRKPSAAPPTSAVGFLAPPPYRSRYAGAEGYLREDVDLISESC